MKIRCHNCYRVLNNDEEWCTRCGAHSDEIEHIIKEGIVLVDEGEILKRSLLFYFLFGILLSGILSVLFGIIFNTVHPGFDYGTVGQKMPDAIMYFSSTNSLLLSGLVCVGVMYLVNYKDLKNYLYFDFKKKNLIVVIIGMIIVIGMVILTKYTPITFIPVHFRDFLIKPNAMMKLSGSMTLIKVIVILVCFAFTEEVALRKALINGFDQMTLVADGWIIFLTSIISTVFTSLVFLLLINTTISNYLIMIGGQLIFHTIFGILYIVNNRNLFYNLILRLMFIILIIVIL